MLVEHMGWKYCFFRKRFNIPILQVNKMVTTWEVGATYLW